MSRKHLPAAVLVSIGCSQRLMRSCQSRRLVQLWSASSQKPQDNYQRDHSEREPDEEASFGHLETPTKAEIIPCRTAAPWLLCWRCERLSLFYHVGRDNFRTLRSSLSVVNGAGRDLIAFAGLDRFVRLCPNFQMFSLGNKFDSVRPAPSQSLLHKHAGALWVDEHWQMDVTTDDGLILSVISVSAMKGPAVSGAQQQVTRS